MACKSIINHITAQVERVISQHEKLEADFQEVCRERDALKLSLREHQEQVQQLKDEVKRLRLAEGLGGAGSDKAKSRARINQLLREVDKCISLLTKEQEIS